MGLKGLICETEAIVWFHHAFTSTEITTCPTPRRCRETFGSNLWWTTKSSASCTESKEATTATSGYATCPYPTTPEINYQREC
jgi:hypothetical protein